MEHRILDRLQILAFLGLHGGVSFLGRFGGAVFHAEGRHVEDLAEDVGIVQVRAGRHGDLEGLVQLAAELELLLPGIAGGGKQELLGQPLVSGENFVGQTVGVVGVIRLGDLLGALGFELFERLGVAGGVTAFGLILGHALFEDLFALCLELLAFGLELGDLLLDLDDLLGVLRVAAVEGLEIVVLVDGVVLEPLQAGGVIGLLVQAQGLSGLDLVLLFLNGAELGCAALEHGVLVEHVLILLELAAVGGVQFDGGIGDLVVGEDDGAVGDKAVGFEHAGKGLGQNGFAGAGFADDGQGLVLIDVQRDAADGGQDTAADVELDFDVLEGEKDFTIGLILHNSVLLLTCGSSGRWRPRGSDRPDRG